VWKVKNKRDNQDYAMKEMSKSVILAKKSVTSINFEKELLSRLNHPFICNICYAFQDEENLYLIVELSNGGDLRYHLFRNIHFNEIQTSKLIINNKNYNKKHNI
jgi:serum/glucocorticoid-regulated kinase 1/serum/glucocorticoid-regulated kinase 2